LVIAGAIVAVLVGFRMFLTAPIDVYPDINDPRVTIMTEAHGWLRQAIPNPRASRKAYPV
jgi:Cu/Ag efflux pump CusA